MEHLESIGVKDKKTLDIGCGDGRHAKLLHEMGSSNVIGVDINEQMIKMAIENNRGVGNMSFEVASGDNLQNEDNSVDVVISNFVLHYFEESYKVFNEIARVLKKDGFFVGTFNITEVDEGFENLYNTQMPIKLGSGEDSIIVENLIKSHDEITNSIKNSGLEIIKEIELEHPNAVVDDSFENKDQIKKRAVMMILQKL
jgi:ubiquinone/menaquinone biosynthesis C-methylase UbiE